jgi:hypothetical protein
VENLFLHTRRYFLPGCHEGYWMGYRAATGAWGKFKQLDKTINSSYTHWGMLNSTGPGNSNISIPEPNGKARNEMCLMANYTMGYGGAFGWADANCNNKQIFMCRIMSERRGRRPCSATPGWTRPRWRRAAAPGEHWQGGARC